MKRLICCLLVLLALPACSSSPTEPPVEVLSDRERTLQALAAYHRESKGDHTHFGRGIFDRSKQQLNAMPNTTPAMRFDLNYAIGEGGVSIGENLRSAEAYERALELLPGIAGKEDLEGVLLLDLAVAWLRVGETENCIHCQNCESCLFPISAAAVHLQRQGSEEAIVYLDRLLEKNPDNIVARWLLNIAHMTLGHPQDVIAEQFRLPVSALESESSFPRFTNVATDALVDEVTLAGGAIADDFDNDRWLDLVVSNWNSNGQLRFFHNNGDGTFEDRTQAAGLEGFCAGLNLVQADYDNDGDLDVLVLRGAWQLSSPLQEHVPNSLLKNDGRGHFTEVLYQAGLGEKHFATQSATWLDYDLDGDLDLYIGNENAHCQLFQNDGTGHFVDVAEQAGVQNGGWTKGVTAGDYDGDGDTDLYVSNLNGDNQLFRNNGSGTFTEVAKELGVTGPRKGFPTWFWDFNNDGVMDLFAASYDGRIEDIANSYFYPEKPPTVELDQLFQGDGEGGFREVAVELGLGRPTLVMGANFGDLDNDGYLDFYLGTGDWEFYGLMPNLMFHNRGGKGFADVTTPGGFGHLQKGHGVAFFDYDHDGDEDVFVELGGAYLGDVFQNALFQNPGFDNAWIKIQLSGTKSNRYGIGARIRIDLATESGSRSIYRWVGNGSSFGANPLRQEIGLGKADSITRLEVYWPVSKTTQVFKDVPVRCLIEIKEDASSFTTIPLPRVLGPPPPGT
jgi:tetratricopeptide (TPR) repeat protein